MISGHSGSPGTFFLPFTCLPASQSLQILPPRFCVQYLLILQMSAETCPLQRGALTCPETTPAPITCIPSTLHLLHPHHPGASHVLGAPVLPHLTTTAQACLVSSTPSAPVTKQELNQHTVDERIKGRKDKKTVSSV